MTTLTTPPKLQFFDANGEPLVGGKLYSYAAGTTTPLVTYTDYGGGTANANPVVLDSRGEASVWLGSARYKLKLTTATDVDIWTVDDVGGADAATLVELATSGGSGLVGFIGAAAGAVARTLQAKGRDTVSSSDYETLQQGLTAAAGGIFRVLSGTHTITAALVPANNTTIILDAGAVITTSTLSIHHIDATGKTAVHVIGPGKLVRTTFDGTAYIAGVCFDSAIDCSCVSVRMEGMQWSGVYMKSATRCRAEWNRIYNHLGSAVQDSAGVHMSANCVDCAAAHNVCSATGWHGINIEGIGAGTSPLRCKVIGNWVSGTTAYGILSYNIDQNDTYTLIEGNSIRDVTGANPSGSGGAGIYIQNTGAVRAIGNDIRNVCTATSNNTLTPGGIGVNNITITRTRPVIEGNTIVDVGLTIAAVQNTNAVTLAAINISTSPNGASIGPNTFIQYAALTTATYVGIYMNACSRVTISSVGMVAPTTGNATGIFGFMNGTSMSTISISSCSINGFAQNYIRFLPLSTEVVSGLTIGGVNCGGGASSINGIQLQNAQGYSVTGTQVDSGNYALYLNACTKGSFSGNRFETTGTFAVGTTGVCTGTDFGVSNYWGGTASKMENAGTGFRVEWYGATAAPAVGTWAVGDRAIRVPAVGQPKAWSCTTAGTAGTHTSEGNL